MYPYKDLFPYYDPSNTDDIFLYFIDVMRLLDAPDDAEPTTKAVYRGIDPCIAGFLQDTMPMIWREVPPEAFITTMNANWMARLSAQPIDEQQTMRLTLCQSLLQIAYHRDLEALVPFAVMWSNQVVEYFRRECYPFLQPKTRKAFEEIAQGRGQEALGL